MTTDGTSQGTRRVESRRERETIGAMLRIYCHDLHACDRPLCDACQELHDYAMQRLENCVFGADKPVCSKCPVHCYRPELRERIRGVMRYAGPRMLLRHPLLAANHLWEKRKPVPELSGQRTPRPLDQRPRDPSGHEESTDA